MEVPMCPDRRTGEIRILRYDQCGYELIVGDRVEFSRRLEPICYLMDRRRRQRIALFHGLQDAGEYGLARWISRRMSLP